MRIVSFFAFAILALNQTQAQAARGPETQIAVAAPAATETSEVAMKIDVEFRTGVFAYTLLGSADLSFFGRENSTLTVNSKANTYEAVFTMKIAAVDFENGTDLQVIEILRTDKNDGSPTGYSHFQRSVIEKGVPIQIIVPGKFQGQRRDYRLTFHY